MALSCISNESETYQMLSLAQSAHMDKSDADQASRIFKDMDTDNSGGLSLEEMGGNQALFDEFDTNKDGVVSPAELQEGLKKIRKQATGQGDAEMENNAFLGRVQSGLAQEDQATETQTASDSTNACDTGGSLNAAGSGASTNRFQSTAVSTPSLLHTLV